jgi:hypothetical protein
MAGPHKSPFDQFMEEAEELLAPFKLMLRLIRASRKKQPSSQPPDLSRRTSLWRQILGWEGFSFVFLTALAFGFLTLPHQYDKARWCFSLAAIALVIKIVYTFEIKTAPKITIALLASVLAGIASNRVNDWVTGMQIDDIVRQAQQDITSIARSYVPRRPAAVPAPPRSEMVFDGQPYEGLNKDDRTQNFKIGDYFAANLNYKAVGPNPVDFIKFDALLFVEPDYSPQTCKKVIAEFKSDLKKYSGKPTTEPETFMQGQPDHFGSAYAWVDKKQKRIFVQDDLDQLRVGTEVAFVIGQITYEDNKKTHHARLCMFLQPPGFPPGIWQSCGGFGKSD